MKHLLYSILLLLALALNSTTSLAYDIVRDEDSGDFFIYCEDADDFANYIQAGFHYEENHEEEGDDEDEDVYYFDYPYNYFPDGHTHHIIIAGKENADIVIPNSVTRIGFMAFYSCRNITNVTIPNSVTVIENGAFSGCGLKKVTIPNSVTAIGDGAFRNNMFESLLIPNTVTTIGNYAFSECYFLKEVNIGNSVTSIGNSAFAGCGYLERVTIPNAVTAIGEETFWGCFSLQSVNIPNSATDIGDRAFYGCSTLQSVEIPNSVTGIGEETFRDCISLKSVIIPNSVTSIGEGAFAACHMVVENIKNETNFDLSEYGLTIADVEQPDGLVIKDNIVVRIRLWAENVSIPESVTDIDINNGAYYNWLNLVNLYCYSATPLELSQPDVFDYFLYDCTLHVPAGSIEDYKKADGWKKFRNIVAIEEETDETFETTDLASLADAVYTDSIKGKTGSQLIIPVKMKNATEASGFQFDLVLPKGVTVDTDEDGFYQIALSTKRTTAAKTNLFESDLQADGSIRVLCNSAKGYSFAGNDGEVALVTVNIAEDIEEGDYPIILKNIVITDVSGDNRRKVGQVVSCLSLSSYTIGDANGDGEIDVADFSAIAAYILGHPSETFEIKAADVNNDQEVDVADLSAIAKLILHPEIDTDDINK